MLETSKERVQLLKTGITGKKIEELYITYNNFKIVRSPIVFELFEIDAKENKNTAINQIAKAECGGQ